MTYEEMIKLAKKPKARNNDREHQIQVACVEWFRLQYPKVAMLLYAIPNGGRRDAVTGKKLKDEGVVRGVCDMNLDVPNIHYHGLRIEMKAGSAGKQSKEQKEFQARVEGQGYKYILCRSFDDFRREVTIYMSNK